MVKKRRGLALGIRLSLLIIITAVVLCAVAVFVGYSSYAYTLEHEFLTRSRQLALTAGSFIDTELMDSHLAQRYVNSRAHDPVYQNTLEILRTLHKNSNALYLFVIKVVPEENLAYYVFDTREAENFHEFGSTVSFEDDGDIINRLMSGDSIDLVARDTVFGGITTVFEPVTDAAGTATAYYVGVDYPMEQLNKERDRYFITLVVTTAIIAAVMSAVILSVIHRTVTRPVLRIAAAADEFLGSGAEAQVIGSGLSSLSRLRIKTGDELQRLSESLQTMEQKIGDYITTLSAVTVRAETDNLTGLYNRGSYRQKVSRHLAERLTDTFKNEIIDAFFLMDLDYFKNVNDTYGHMTGDRVLTGFAHAVRSVFRENDILARQGGDEFVVFCPGIGSEAIVRLKAERLREAIASTAPPDAKDMRVTASIGVALVPRDGTTFDELYSNADAALYLAKERGRDQYVIYTPPEEK